MNEKEQDEKNKEKTESERFEPEEVEEKAVVGTPQRKKKRTQNTPLKGRSPKVIKHAVAKAKAKATKEESDDEDKPKNTKAQERAEKNKET